jgi:hypothetical protein
MALFPNKFRDENPSLAMMLLRIAVVIGVLILLFFAFR